MKKLLFVVNGHSGKGQIKNKLLDIIDIMIKEGYHVQVHTTQEREDATKVVREQAKYYDLVVCRVKCVPRLVISRQEVQTILPILWRFQKI